MLMALHSCQIVAGPGLRRSSVDIVWFRHGPGLVVVERRARSAALRQYRYNDRIARRWPRAALIDRTSARPGGRSGSNLTPISVQSKGAATAAYVLCAVA